MDNYQSYKKVDILEEPETSRLRKQFKEYMQEFFNAADLLEKRRSEVENSFAPKIKKNKILKKIELALLTSLPPIFLILALICFVRYNSNILPEFYFYIGLCILTVLLPLILLLFNKKHYNDIIFKRSLKVDEFTAHYEDNGLNKIYLASRIVPELIIEKQYGKKYEEFQRKASKEEFDKTHNILIKNAKTFLIKNEATSPYQIASFYESWYQANSKPINVVNNKERILINSAKEKRIS